MLYITVTSRLVILSFSSVPNTTSSNGAKTSDNTNRAWVLKLLLLLLDSRGGAVGGSASEISESKLLDWSEAVSG